MKPKAKPEVPQNINQLSKSIGESRQWLAVLAKLPDHPSLKPIDVEAWSKYCKEKKGSQDPELKKRKLIADVEAKEADARMKKREDRRQAGETRLKTEIATECIAAMAEFDSSIRSKLPDLSVKCEGLAAVQSLPQMERVYDDAMERLKERLTALGA